MSRCEQCRYWRVLDSIDKAKLHRDDVIGRCHRYPPQLDAVWAGANEEQHGIGCEAAVHAWYQPLTYAASWCGEYRAIGAPRREVQIQRRKRR